MVSIPLQTEIPLFPNLPVTLGSPMTPHFAEGVTDISNLLPCLLRGLINQFPDSIPVPNSDTQRIDPIVEELIWDKVSKWDMGLPSHIYTKPIIAGHDIAAIAYRHVSPELQAEIALFTGLGILIDDEIIGTPAVREFIPRFCTSSCQLHPSLDRFAETVHGIRKHFAEYGANAILSSTIDYVNSELFQKGAKDMSLSRGSIPFTKYIRGKDGYCEAFAAFVWPKDDFPDPVEFIQAFPDTMEFLALVNDIFSYYKEMKAGEAGTFISKFALANGTLEGDAIRDLIDYVIVITRRVREILGDGKAREAWESMAAGYIRFHLLAERYKLVEILPDIVSPHDVAI